MTHTAKCMLGTTPLAMYLYLVSLTPITSLQHCEHYYKNLKEQVYIPKAKAPVVTCVPAVDICPCCPKHCEISTCHYTDECSWSLQWTTTLATTTASHGP